LAASADGVTRVWEPASGRVIHELRQYGAVHRAAFSPDRRWIASVGDDRRVHLWDAKTGALQRELAGHDGGITDVAWAADGRQLVTASDDLTARVWSVVDDVPPI